MLTAKHVKSLKEQVKDLMASRSMRHTRAELAGT